MDDVIQSRMPGTPFFAILAAQLMCAQWGYISATELAAVQSNDGGVIIIIIMLHV